MSAKAEILVQLCINGRPMWRKAKTVRGELTFQMSDREYDRVLDVAIIELGNQVKIARAKADVKEKVEAK